MKQIRWFDRSFDFDFTQNIFPAIVERLSGTPARLEEKLAAIPENLLRLRPNDTWSILENIGHLTDLEPLWQGRLEDFLSGATVLRPADLTNATTDAANHNAFTPQVLLAGFRAARTRTIGMLEPLTEADIFRTALHPRLHQPMRLMDSFLFVAEHDDHHLARITEIVRNLKK
jgi:uncharacterized damage-inducible protein DinB